MREIITTGKTLEEAIEVACSTLGVSRDQVNCEIITMPRRRLFRSEPAKVRVTVTEDDFSVKDLLMEAEQPKAEPKAADEAPAERKEGSSKRRRKKSKKARTEDAKPEVKAEEPTAEKAEPELVMEPEEPEEEIALDALPVGGAAAFEYLKAIAAGLGANNVNYRAVKIRDGVKFVIDGEDAAILIGRRGETMDSLQYLCLLVSNRAGDDYCKITLDVAGYRSKRERTLEALAQKVARKVLKTRYSQTLEPMNPYERRIVHSAIQKIEGVKSESVGQDPNRRIVVSLVSGGKDSGRGGRGGRGGRNGNRDRKPRDNREPRERRESAPVKEDNRELNLEVAPKEFQRIDVAPQRPTEAPEKAAPHKEEAPKNLNLYQKIEL